MVTRGYRKEAGIDEVTLRRFLEKGPLVEPECELLRKLLARGGARGLAPAKEMFWALGVAMRRSSGPWPTARDDKYLQEPTYLKPLKEIDCRCPTVTM